MKTVKEKAISAEIEFMNWCIKKGKVKVFFPGEDFKKLHTAFKKEKKKQKDVPFIPYQMRIPPIDIIL